MSTIYKVTGNTYNVKEIIRACGFKWNGDVKRWEGGESAKAAMENRRRIKYDGKLLSAAGINVVEAGPVAVCYYCGMPAVGFSLGEPACADCGG